MITVFVFLLIFLALYLLAQYQNSAIKWKSFLQRKSNPPNIESVYGTCRNYFCKYCSYPSDTIIGDDERAPDLVCLECHEAIDIITMGPDYHDHRGGIGAVLEVYAHHISNFHFIPSYKGSFKHFWVYIISIFKLTFQLITNWKIKIIHLHNASKASFFRKSILLLIGKLFGKKVILHIHGAKFDIFYNNANPLIKRYIKYIIEKADVVICLSLQWKAFFETSFRIRKLEILNNIVEKAKEYEPAIKPTSGINFLFLGYIGDRKGIFDLIKVLNDNDELFKGKYTLTIAGNGEIERLKTAIKNYPAIQYAGWVKGHDKEELLRKCDVYVLPSYNEGLPISVLEAMAYGKPIISTRVGGIPEIVTTGYNGWLINPGDLQALKVAVSEALNNNTLSAYGANSLKSASNYQPDHVMEKLNKIYSNELA